MPPGYLPDPNSPEAQAAWMASVEQRLAQMKQGQPNTTALGYIIKSTNQLGIGMGVTVAVSGLTLSAAVGTRRLIKISGFLVYQWNNPSGAATSDTLNGEILKDGVLLNENAVESTIGAGSSFLNSTLLLAIDVAPTVGTHTYSVSVATGGAGGNSLDILAASANAFLLVEDIGAAPA